MSISNKRRFNGSDSQEPLKSCKIYKINTIDYDIYNLFHSYTEFYKTMKTYKLNYTIFIYHIHQHNEYLNRSNEKHINTQTLNDMFTNICNIETIEKTLLDTSTITDIKNNLNRLRTYNDVYITEQINGIDTKLSYTIDELSASQLILTQQNNLNSNHCRLKKYNENTFDNITMVLNTIGSKLHTITLFYNILNHLAQKQIITTDQVDTYYNMLV